MARHAAPPRIVPGDSGPARLPAGSVPVAEPRDDRFELFDLRVEVTAGDGAPIYCGAQVGDYFELRGDRKSTRLNSSHLRRTP